MPKAARAGLQSQVDSLTKRLAAANTRSNAHVKTLEADFTALAAQMGRTKAGHTRLTRRVSELSKTITKDMTAMQSEVAHDLSAALANPTLETLQSALSAADIRISESEEAQNAAIARINHHISDIATIVESRLTDEAKTREAAMAEMKSAMQAGHTQLQDAQSQSEQAMQLRFSEMQGESAAAIRTIGDKVVDVADEMGRRRETLETKLRQELNEATLSASSEFEQFRRIMERRLEALETELGGVEGHIDRAVTPLASRVEGLEYGLTAAPTVQDAPSFPAAPAIGATPIAAAAAPISAAPLSGGVSGPSAQSPAIADNPYAQPVSQPVATQPITDDAFSPAPPAASAAVTPPQGYSVDPQAEQAVALGREDIVSGVPKAVPYDPAAYKDYTPPQAPYAQAAIQAPVQAPIQAPYEQSAYTQAPQLQALETPPFPTDAPQMEAAPLDIAPLDSAPLDIPPMDIPPMDSALTLDDSDLPYADPAYAEGLGLAAADETMSAARPGAFETLKKIGGKARKGGAVSKLAANANASGGTLLTPRNLKVGGMVAAIGLVGFIGAQTLSKKDVNPTTAEFQTASQTTSLGLDPASKNIAGTPPTSARPTLSQNPEILGPNTPSGALAITEDTIGKYADNRQVQLTEGGASELETAANAGNTVAQLQLGLSKLESGDIEGGVMFIRAAANKDQPAALYRLAKLYEAGQGVGQDLKTARELTERAARGGNRIAMHDLALYFAEGRGGVDIDMPTAAKWFEKAADRGVVDSQFNLGVLFESGQGLPQDLEAALVWYTIAGTQGDQMAAGRGGVLRKTLTEEQTSRADTRISAYAPSRIDEEANGIFKNVPWAKPAQTAQVDTAQTAGVRQTQTLLNELGYEVGEADGAVGSKTRTAIKSFERANGLEETGVVSNELIERLEIAAGA